MGITTTVIEMDTRVSILSICARATPFKTISDHMQTLRNRISTRWRAPAPRNRLVYPYGSACPLQSEPGLYPMTIIPHPHTFIRYPSSSICDRNTLYNPIHGLEGSVGFSTSTRNLPTALKTDQFWRLLRGI